MLDRLTVETFTPHVGETFHLRLSDTERMPVTLIGAEASANHGMTGSARAPFSLLFRPPQGQVPPQRTYRVEHERIGTLEIFLVPITPDAQGPRLEAVFS